MIATSASASIAASQPVLPGTWKLVRGRAITLRPATDGVLRVAHGRVWATMDGPHGRRPDDGGDHVLEIGRSMFVRAGQRVVIEAWNPSGASYFAWDPVYAPEPVARPALNFSGVLQPLADLRAAAGLAGRALGQLAVGGTRLAAQVVRGWMPARRPHGMLG